MRRLYTLLLYLALPFATLGVLWRGLRTREYWSGGLARFGLGPARSGGGLWVHAVSVGEVQVASILIAALRERDHALEITLTCATPTGRTRARALLPGIEVRYAPYDLPGCLRRCLALLRPRLLIIIEAELWPNMLHQVSRAGVPILIASARISARSARIYQRLPGLMRAALAANVWVGAQTAADLERFEALGINPQRLTLVGNVKFDRTLPDDIYERGVLLRACYASGRAVWVAGSTHPQEEPIVLEAHRRLRVREPRALLILAPRHPARFAAAAAAIAAHGFRFVRRSNVGSDTEIRSALGLDGSYDVLLLDTLGELLEFYAAADVAFVGGSLVPVGGHNLLEPAALGLPVIAGPEQFNSPDIARALAQQGALITVRNAAELADALAGLLGDVDRRARKGDAARLAIDAHRGALGKVLRLIDTLMPPAGAV
ncbi:MAG TPA: 3-deoxy-D-manno-octulosonic acid transferase [Steroidobacteraceae bacterium]|nr:3-deoxy-D-manno-octulosonic acid transferase [Steroidobacteraceae bacterium]